MSQAQKRLPYSPLPTVPLRILVLGLSWGRGGESDPSTCLPLQGPRPTLLYPLQLCRDADHHGLHSGAASLLQVPPGEEWAGSPEGTPLGWGEGVQGAWCRRGPALTSGVLSMSLGADL